MKTTALLGSSLLLLSLFSFACSAADSNDDAASSDDELSFSFGQTSHPDAVKDCRAAHTKASKAASSTTATLETESTFRACLQKANDAALKPIKESLTKNGSSLVSRAEAAVLQFRNKSLTLCEELSKADPEYGRSIGRIDSAQCAANREATLADVIDKFVFASRDTGLKSPEPNLHSACAEAHELMLRNGDPRDADDALDTYAGCVAQDADDLSPRVAKSELSHDASFGPESAALTRAHGAIRGAYLAARDLCPILAEAGRSGLGGARSAAASCSGSVAEDVYLTVVATVGNGGDADAGL